MINDVTNNINKYELGIALDNMAFVAIGITLGAAFEGANKKEVEKKEKQ